MRQRFDPRRAAPDAHGRNRRFLTRREGVMTIEGLIILLIVGAIAGWLAGVIMKGYGFGLIGNIAVGIVGAVIGGWLLPRIGLVIGGGIIGSIINATIGAVILLFIIGLVKR
jgi:uncharacterized membrane protein YeaQ/YmgE (transglycosylase-associated protein family)